MLSGMLRHRGMAPTRSGTVPWRVAREVWGHNKSSREWKIRSGRSVPDGLKIVAQKGATRRQGRVARQESVSPDCLK